MKKENRSRFLIKVGKNRYLSTNFRSFKSAYEAAEEMLTPEDFKSASVSHFVETEDETQLHAKGTEVTLTRQMFNFHKGEKMILDKVNIELGGWWAKHPTENSGFFHIKNDFTL